MCEDKINIIVFSRDRAMQLDLHLRSLEKTFKEFNQTQINVVYDFTSIEYFDAYEKLKEKCPTNINFFTDNEFGTFKETLLRLMDETKEFTMFLCDDIIFVNNWSLKDKEIQILKTDKNVMTTSLRLWSGIDFCYATNTNSPQPKFLNEFCWNWELASGDWGYPMSCDGNVFLTSFIKGKTALINFKYPNQFESALAETVDRSIKYASCFLEAPKLINIPANIVQNVYKNKHGNIRSASELNQLYLEDKILDLDFYLGKSFNTVHVELELKVK